MLRAQLRERKDELVRTQQARLLQYKSGLHPEPPRPKLPSDGTKEELAAAAAENPAADGTEALPEPGLASKDTCTEAVGAAEGIVADALQSTNAQLTAENVRLKEQGTRLASELAHVRGRQAQELQALQAQLDALSGSEQCHHTTAEEEEQGLAYASDDAGGRGGDAQLEEAMHMQASLLQSHAHLRAANRELVRKVEALREQVAALSAGRGAAARQLQPGRRQPRTRAGVLFRATASLQGTPARGRPRGRRVQVVLTEEWLTCLAAEADDSLALGRALRRDALRAVRRLELRGEAPHELHVRVKAAQAAERRLEQGESGATAVAEQQEEEEECGCRGCCCCFTLRVASAELLLDALLSALALCQQVEVHPRTSCCTRRYLIRQRQPHPWLEA
eukprot:scaffold1127_cov361-Prasinococcus_capsulatus_cf.AAC.15